jgi:nicotinate phosphoribosyltransferase
MRDAAGRAAEDVLALRDEPPPVAGRPLLEPVMRGGELTRRHPPLDAIRDHCAAAIRELGDEAIRLKDPVRHPVRYSERLTAHQRELERQAGQESAR